MTFLPTRDSAALSSAAAGTDGTTVTDAAGTVLGAIGADNSNNAFASTSVASNADGSVLERLEYLQAGNPGTSFVLQVVVTSSAIPNNTQTAGAITGAASGAIVIEDIILETNATGIAGPTNLEFTTDNVSGLTGAAAPNILQAVSALGANKTVVCKTSSTTKILPLTLETGKKLYLDGDDGAGTGAGTMRVTLLCRRVAAGGSLAAGGIGV